MKSFKQFIKEEVKLTEEYKVKKTGVKSTIAHPDGKPVHDIIHNGEVIGKIEPYSAYSEKRTPGSRIVSSRKNVTHYSLDFHSGKGPKSHEIGMYSKMGHTSPKSALNAAEKVHSQWKSKNEEIELDEISTSTLSSYSIKAARQGDDRIAGQKMADEKIRKKDGYSSTAKVPAK